MTEEKIRAFVDKYNWTFAKTYANRAPHEYYVKDKLDPEGQKEFEEFVAFIRENGFECKFWGYAYIYYELDGRYYWTMGEPVEETTILNRCLISEYEIVGNEMKWRRNRE